MKVLLVNGSPHEQGCTNRALEELQAQFAREDAEAEIFWLGKSMQPCIADAFPGGVCGAVALSSAPVRRAGPLCF